MRGLLVGEIAKRVPVHPETVKRLEEKGLIESYRDCNGWRRYDLKVVETIRGLYGLSDAGENTKEEGQ